MGEKKRRLALQAVQAAGPAADESSAAGDIAAKTSLASGGQGAGMVAQWLRQARQCLQAGKLVEAVNLFQQVRQHADSLTPQMRAQALHFQGMALLQAGQAPAGINLMQQALELEFDNALYHYNLALALASQGMAQAVPVMCRAWALDRQDAEVTQSLVDLLLQSGLRSEAKTVLQSVPSGDMPDALSADSQSSPQSSLQNIFPNISQNISQNRQQTSPQNRQQIGALLDLLAQLQFADNELPQAVDSFARACAHDPALLAQRRIGFAVPNAPARAETHLTDEAWVQELDLHILDHCLPAPQAYREQALQQAFHARRYAGQNYPGLQTDGMDVPDIMQLIANQLGKTIKFISPDNGSYRASFQDSMARSDIHADNESGGNFLSYAAVLYLNLPAQCQGGTHFWQHQGTGWRRRPPDFDVRAAGFADFKSFLQRALPRQEAGQQYNAMLAQRQGWQCTMQVPMQFNRLIIYRGDFFHSIGDVFGSTMQDARLAQLFFFDVVP